MKYGPRLDVWVVGFLVGASLAAGAYLAVRFNLGGILDSPPRVSAELPPIPPALNPPTNVRHRRKTAHGISSHSKGAPLRDSQTGAAQPDATEEPALGLPTVPGTSAALASAAQAPERKILKPLGLVQKASGAVEAIVSDGDRVLVVHVGDAFQEKYTVAQIAPGGVEIVAASPRLAVASSDTKVVSSSNLVNGTSSEAWAYSPSLASRSRDRKPDHLALDGGKMGRAKGKEGSVLEVGLATSGRQAENTQVALARTNNDSARPLGYAKKADGTDIAIVSDGDSVRLVQPSKSLTAHAAPRTNLAGVAIAESRVPPGPNVDRRGQDLPTPQSIAAAHNLRPQMASTVRDVSTGTRSPDRVLGASTTLGFVERANGRLEAIVDDRGGIRLSQVSQPPPSTLLAGIVSAQPSGAPEAMPGGVEQPVDPMGRIGNYPATTIAASRRPQTERLAPKAWGGTLQAEGSSMAGSPQPGSYPSQLPPEAEVTVADELVIPEKPPPDVAMVEGALGLATEAKGSLDRDAAILGSLGYANPQGDRASPEVSPFEPATPPTGPPQPDSQVLRSFGYEEWQYGRGSPIAASAGLKEGAGYSGNPIFLKPLGYLEWKGGRVFAVISDGDGGVCLVTEGDTLEGRFRVVKITPDAVEIVELPARKTSSAPSLGVDSDAARLPYSVEALPAATSIAVLPLQRTDPSHALVPRVMAQSAQVARGRVGEKAAGFHAHRTAHRIPACALRDATQAPPSRGVSWLASPVLWTHAADGPTSRIP